MASQNEQISHITVLDILHGPGEVLVVVASKGTFFSRQRVSISLTFNITQSLCICLCISPYYFKLFSYDKFSLTSTQQFHLKVLIEML